MPDEKASLPPHVARSIYSPAPGCRSVASAASASLPIGGCCGCGCFLEGSPRFVLLSAARGAWPSMPCCRLGKRWKELGLAHRADLGESIQPRKTSITEVQQLQLPREDQSAAWLWLLHEAAAVGGDASMRAARGCAEGWLPIVLVQRSPYICDAGRLRFFREFSALHFNSQLRAASCCWQRLAARCQSEPMKREGGPQT